MIPADPLATAPALDQRQKAAIVTRYLLSEGVELPLDQLPDRHQRALAMALAEMKVVDKTTLDSVLQEFTEQLDGIGMSSAGGMAGALSVLDGHLSPQTAKSIREEAGLLSRGDPWDQVAALEVIDLCEIVERESLYVAAVVVSKLPVTKAADLLQSLPGPEARKLAMAMSQTGKIRPDAVARIGLSLADQLASNPPRAFDEEPVDRVGEILNYSSGDTRDELLDEIDREDAEFATALRKKIFTFAHIPVRISPIDVPGILREADQDDIIAALAGAFSTGDDTPEIDAAEFLMANISQRMATTLREEAHEISGMKPRDAEIAMTKIVTVIRRLISEGKINLMERDEDAEDAAA